MLRTALGMLLVAHGAVTAAIWLAPLAPDAPFNPNHSWLLGDSRTFAAPISGLMATGLAITGVALLSHQTWWTGAAIGFGTTAAAFMLLYFHPWLLLGIAINAATAAAAISSS